MGSANRWNMGAQESISGIFIKLTYSQCVLGPSRMTFHTVNTAILDMQLAPFSLTSKTLSSLLYDTSAVIAGGAVVHYLYNSTNTAAAKPMADEADLDFWIYDPTMTMDMDAYHTSRAFRSLVEKRFEQAFPDYKPTTCPTPTHNISYATLSDAFTAQGGTSLSIRWWRHTTTGRMINLIYMSKPPAKAIPLFDLPICRAMMFGLHTGDLMGDWPAVAIQDIREQRLTLPTGSVEKKTLETRIAKYCARYGLTVSAG